MPKVRGQSYWPCPVYVARFSDGTECRMSVWSQQGKPLDFARGRRICCSAIGNERHRAAYRSRTVSGRLGWRGWHPDDVGHSAPATDIIAGHFEHDGQIITDPIFTAQATAPKPKASPLDRLIARVNKLGANDLVRLSEAIDRAFETAE